MECIHMVWEARAHSLYKDMCVSFPSSYWGFTTRGEVVDLLHQSRSLSQGVLEKVKDYGSHVQNLVDQFWRHVRKEGGEQVASIMVGIEGLILKHFISGIRPEICQTVQYERATTFVRTLSIALQWEEIIEEDKVDKSVTTKGLSLGVLPYVPVQAKQTSSMPTVAPGMIPDSLQDAVSQLSSQISKLSLDLLQEKERRPPWQFNKWPNGNGNQVQYRAPPDLNNVVLWMQWERKFPKKFPMTT